MFIIFSGTPPSPAMDCDVGGTQRPRPTQRTTEVPTKGPTEAPTEIPTGKGLHLEI